MNEYMASDMAMAARQSFSSRFWAALGFGLSGYGDMVDWRNNEAHDRVFAPGALVTDTIVHVDLADRLRLLVSGRLRLEVSTPARRRKRAAKKRQQKSA